MSESYSICAYCGKQFPPYRKQRFCSKQCFGDNLRIFLNCLHCGKRFHKKEKEQKYCSGECFHTAHSGEKHGRFKGGWLDHEGYRLIGVDGRTVREHRYIMEQALGRTLAPHEHVHHINEIKTDNRLENLELVVTNDHNLKHAKYFRDDVSKECSRCRQTKSRDEFYPNPAQAKTGRDPHSSQCRECSILSNREYKAKLKQAATTD